jgi:hypothetical protein
LTTPASLAAILPFTILNLVRYYLLLQECDHDATQDESRGWFLPRGE